MRRGGVPEVSMSSAGSKAQHAASDVRPAAAIHPVLISPFTKNDVPMAEEISRLNQEIARLRRRLRHAHVDSIMALVATVEAKDKYTERHSAQVSIYAERLAKAAGLSEADVEVVVIAALLHDIGKIAIPDAILLKPGKLTPSEFEKIMEHPARGVEILKRVGFLERELPLVMHHHEWFDGRGYPLHLKGAAIPFGARLLQVADSIDAMLSPRTYKRAMSVAETIQELSDWRGMQFDPDVAELGIAMLEQQPEEASTILHSWADDAPKAAGTVPWPTPSPATFSGPRFGIASIPVTAH